jgi:hypothetical protein
MDLRKYLSLAVLPRVYESQSLLPESFVRPTERERGTAYPILSVPSPKVLVRSYPRQHGKWRPNARRGRRNAGGVSACLEANKGPISHFIGAGHTGARQAHLKNVEDRSKTGQAPVNGYSDGPALRRVSAAQAAMFSLYLTT